MEKLIRQVNPRHVIAFIIYAVTCAWLYAIESRLYAGALKTVFFYALVYPPLFLLSHKAFDKRFVKKERSKTRKAVNNAVAFIVYAGIMVAGWFLMYKDSYTQRLAFWQLVSVFPAFCLILFFEEQRYGNAKTGLRASAVSITYSLIFLATALFLLITKPASVNGARGILLDQGYENPAYVSYYPTADIIGLFITGDPPTGWPPDSEDKLGVYLFSGNQDGRDYGVFIDVDSGGTVTRLDLEYNDFLRNSIEHKRAR